MTRRGAAIARHRRRPLLLTLTLFSSLTSASCDQLEYHPERACSIQATVVKDLLDDGSFEADGTSIEANLPLEEHLPLGAGPRSATCEVRFGDGAFTVDARIIPEPDAQHLADTYQRSPHSYTDSQGAGIASPQGGDYVCGRVRTRIDPADDLAFAANDELVQTALTQVVADVGCYPD